MLDGNVLIVGGSLESDSIPSENEIDMLSTTEIYDTKTGTFIPSGNLSDARSNHTATRLKSGKVLIVGCALKKIIGLGLGDLGISPEVTFTGCSSSEIYDPNI